LRRIGLLVLLTLLARRPAIAISRLGPALGSAPAVGIPTDSHGMAREGDQPQLEHVRRGALTLHEAHRAGVIRQQGGESLGAARIGRPLGDLALPKIEHGFGPPVDLCSAPHGASISTRQRLR
jgi:hypothetical protein